MGWENLLSVALVVALGLMLVSAGIEDVRVREIANWKNAAIALAAPLFWWSSGLSLWPDMAVQLLFAGIVFAIFCGVFAMGWMGGGDVKLIAALSLWMPLVRFVDMMIIMSIAGGVVTLVMVIDSVIRKSSRAIEVPYGVAIAIAALLVLREPLFNQFS
ncbi:A24 family peptidase [Sphingomonas oligophenolica]|uniref:Peptidase n=1 Tax=Sphingomonas oligophenolica TaxID=301154 RepID=A0A502CL08_9SPHN|nr:prepilin peptidase [Sphingomonas oligophenolica]TPG13513.1 peptidase [Sphingomonas oligophenolica]